MNAPMVTVSGGKDAAILQLRGNGRAEAAAQLQQQLLQSGIDQDVWIDWEQAEHVDACVLQVLLALRTQLAQRGFSLNVVKDHPGVREYLQLAGLSSAFPPCSRPVEMQEAQDA